MDKEIRTIAMELEIREAQEDKKKTVSGYAVKWEQLSDKFGWFIRFREKFSKGAFTESLKRDNQKALWNHNTDYVLGNKRAGTLRLKEDDTGLRFDIDLPDNSWGNDAHESIKRGDVDGVSFGFKMIKQELDENDPDNIIRTVQQAQLFEVSPTPFPAFSQSEVQARNIDKVIEEYRAANPRQPVPEPESKLSEQKKDFYRIKNKIYQEVN